MMFTGLVEALGTVCELERQGPGLQLTVSHSQLSSDAPIGSSIAVNGCCLTVVRAEGSRLTFELGQETLSRTNLGDRNVGDFVNLERSLRLSDRLGGHFVTGHVDVVGWLDQRIDDEGWSKFWFGLPSSWSHQLASKGSIAVDGISLTLVDVEDGRFSVALIPHTLKHTTLGALQAGGRVNLETDLLAKYVERQLQFRG